MGRLSSQDAALRCLSLIHEATGAPLIDGTLTPSMESLMKATLLLDALRADILEQRSMLAKHGRDALNHTVTIR